MDDKILPIILIIGAALFVYMMFFKKKEGVQEN